MYIYYIELIFELFVLVVDFVYYFYMLVRLIEFFIKINSYCQWILWYYLWYIIIKIIIIYIFIYDKDVWY